MPESSRRLEGDFVGQTAEILLDRGGEWRPATWDGEYWREPIETMSGHKPGWDKSVAAIRNRSLVRPTPCASGEVRVVDPETGAEKGQKPEQYGLIPVWALSEVARVYGRGAEKYAARNWEGGYRWTLSYDALQRHINAFWGGEELDPDDRLHHLAHAAFHLFALMTYHRFGLGTDDRSGVGRDV